MKCFVSFLVDLSETSQDSVDVTRTHSNNTTAAATSIPQQQHSTLTSLLKQSNRPPPVSRPIKDSSAQESGASLVEEGIRIAQQYGMADFADELLKSMNGSDSEVDEQAEWNREVEKDMLEQNLTQQTSSS